MFNIPNATHNTFSLLNYLPLSGQILHGGNNHSPQVSYRIVNMSGIVNIRDWNYCSYEQKLIHWMPIKHMKNEG